MNDQDIIRLLEQRSEQGLAELKNTYADYLFTIANSILTDREDSEECVNDVYLRVWNSIPPNHPEVLSSFIGRIARNLALDTLKKRQAQKRGSGVGSTQLEKLDNFLTQPSVFLQGEESDDIRAAMDRFLRNLSSVEREVFTDHYLYSTPLASIAAQREMTLSCVTSMLFRLRKRLKAVLVQSEIRI